MKNRNDSGAHLRRRCFLESPATAEQSGDSLSQGNRRLTRDPDGEWLCVRQAKDWRVFAGCEQVPVGVAMPAGEVASGMVVYGSPVSVSLQT